MNPQMNISTVSFPKYWSQVVILFCKIWLTIVT